MEEGALEHQEEWFTQGGLTFSKRSTIPRSTLSAVSLISFSASTATNERQGITLPANS